MADSDFDLLHISDTLDEINGESIDTNPDYGMNYTYLYIGMSGQKMVDKLNENFHATDAEFLAVANALAMRILSHQIKEIKVEDNVVYYTTDGTHWYSLQASWGNIAGNILDQTDLQEALSDKVGSTEFNLLSNSVDSLDSSVDTLETNMTTAQSDITGLSNQINSDTGILVRLGNVETTLGTKISSEQVKVIRTTNGTSLEFTTDGSTWHPVSSAGVVEWGQIIGNISEQADLQLIINNLQSDMSDLDNRLTDDMSNLSGDLATNIAALQEDITNLSTDVSSNISNLNDRVVAAEGLVNNLSIDVTNIGDRVTNLETDTSNISNILNSTVDTVANMVPTLESVENATINLDNRVTDLEDNVSNISSNMEVLENIVNNAVTDVSNLSEDVINISNNLSDHITNNSNPHGVDASQVGLGNVDNTSDLDKPVSNLQKQYIDSAITVISIDHLTYENLANTPNNIFYIINDL